MLVIFGLLDGQGFGRTGNNAEIAENALAVNDFEHRGSQDKRFIGTDRDAEGALRTCLMIQFQFASDH